MAVERDEKGAVRPAWHTPWRKVLLALALSLAGTIVAGGLLFTLRPDVWWIAGAGLLALFGGGVYLGRAAGEVEPLHGTLLAILYFGMVVVVLFGGTLAEALPEPLPGLAIGDSTFFFVWPLLQLVAGVAGSVLGGRWARHKGRAT